MRKFVIILVLIAALGGGTFYWVKHRTGGPTATAAPTIVTAIRDNIRLGVECTGTVVSNLDVEIKCEAGGEIISIPYDISDVVQRGDLLAELNPENEERNLRNAQISLQSARARLYQASQTLRNAELNLELKRRRADVALRSAQAQYEDARAKAERVRALYENERISEEQYESAQTAATLASVALENSHLAIEELDIEDENLEIRRQEVRQAEASYLSAQINLEIAERRLRETKVFAPISGVVAQRNVQVGQIIASALSNVGGGTTLMILSDLSRIYVEASVDESDIGKIEVGQEAQIRVDAFPQERFRGRVERIAAQGRLVSNVVTFEVKIEVLGRNKEKLKPQMTANVDILVAKSENTITLPTQAIQSDPEGIFVMVPGTEPGSTVHRPVEVGLDDGMSVEIVSGLSEGEEVLIPTGGAGGLWTRSEGNPDMAQRMQNRMLMRGLRR